MKPRAPALAFALILLTVLSAQTIRKTSAVSASNSRPLIYWPEGIETAESLKKAGIERLAVPAGTAEAWRKTGFQVVELRQDEFTRREKLLAPRITGRANVASATRRPWLDTNGWRFVRDPAGKFYYELPQGKAAIALAEAFTYKADAILKIDRADLAQAGAMLAFIKKLSNENYPPIADIGVIDDKSAETGEVMNLLMRRNLLFDVIATPDPRFRVNIKLGSEGYPKDAAADPSEFAQRIRERLSDENRSLRIYGTETVICRLTGLDGRARLHLLNYAGRDIDGLRLRLRGKYGHIEVRSFDHSQIDPEEIVNDETATEFSISGVGIYTVIDLDR